MSKIAAKDIKVKYNNVEVAGVKSLSATLKQNFSTDRVKSSGSGPQRQPENVEMSGSFVMTVGYAKWKDIQSDMLSKTKRNVSIYNGVTKLFGALCIIDASSVAAPVDGKVEVTVNFKSSDQVTNS